MDEKILELMWTLLSTAIGIAGLLMAFKYRKVKKLIYSVTGSNLIRDFSSEIDGLEIKYNNSHIKNLTVSKILLMNKGTEAIRFNEDVPSKSHLTIKVKDGEILNAKIIFNSDGHNEASIKRVNKESANIVFDYMSPKDGLVFQIIHTSKDPNKIFLEGHLKDRPKEIKRISSIKIQGRWEKILPLFMFFIPFLIFSVLLLITTYENACGSSILSFLILVPLLSDLSERYREKFREEIIRIFLEEEYTERNIQKKGR